VLLDQFEYLRQCYLVARERIGLVDHVPPLRSTTRRRVSVMPIRSTDPD
jgi:hypothetical protein